MRLRRHRFLPQMDILSSRLAPSTIAAVAPADTGSNDPAAVGMAPGDAVPATDDQDLAPADDGDGDGGSTDYPPGYPMAPEPYICPPYTAATPVYACDAY